GLKRSEHPPRIPNQASLENQFRRPCNKTQWLPPESPLIRLLLSPFRLQKLQLHCSPLPHRNLPTSRLQPPRPRQSSHSSFICCLLTTLARNGFPSFFRVCRERNPFFRVSLFLQLHDFHEVFSSLCRVLVFLVGSRSFF